MIDIFMESLLGALVAFGSVVTIQPGMGALAFCAVVILTMFAAETFDPRLMWDAADEVRGEGGLIVADRPAWTTAILSVMTEQAPAARGSCVLDQDRRSCWHTYSNMRGLVE